MDKKKHAQCTFGTHCRYAGVWTTYSPPNTIKITITAGEIAIADSTEGARDPTAIPE
jgi:hypothetical protein